MEILRNYDITKLNTFGVSTCAREFVEINTEKDLKKLLELAEFKQNKKIFLGGGSNVLFTKDFDGLVVLNMLQGIEILSETPTQVTIRSLGGTIWHDLVLFTVGRGYWGLENLSFIPGTVGAAPMQNIGAYGADLKNVLESVETIELQTGTKKVFTEGECKLGYRDSVFKNELKGKYFILAITLTLSKIPKPDLSYKILSDYIQEHQIKIETSKDISDVVTNIRKSKLPDPKQIGNAGSFFKNIFVSEEKLEELLKLYPEIKYFKENGRIKIASAWLIEQCGFKGRRVGNVGVHAQHALVLVHYGGGSGGEIKNLAQEIIDSVFNKFGLQLIPEVNLI